MLAETFAHGFKDPEGAALHPQTGELWMIDHGPQGGDEINIVRAGKDYGWPDVVLRHGSTMRASRTAARTSSVGTGKTAMNGVEQPIYYWVPSIAPSGMMFYTGDLFPEWKGNLFVGAMAGQHLVRLVLNGERVVAEEKLLADRKQRIREVRQAPDGIDLHPAGRVHRAADAEEVTHEVHDEREVHEDCSSCSSRSSWPSCFKNRTAR